MNGYKFYKDFNQSLLMLGCFLALTTVNSECGQRAWRAMRIYMQVLRVTQLLKANHLKMGAQTYSTVYWCYLK